MQADGDVAAGADRHERRCCAPLQGTIVSIDVARATLVRAGQQVARDGGDEDGARHRRRRSRPASSGIAVAAGDAVLEGAPLLFIEPADVERGAPASRTRSTSTHIRPDLAEVLARHALTLDAARPDAVARRRATKQRTARENIEDLCDPGTFVEYGPLVLAAQRAGARSTS